MDHIRFTTFGNRIKVRLNSDRTITIRSDHVHVDTRPLTDTQLVQIITWGRKLMLPNYDPKKDLLDDITCVYYNRIDYAEKRDSLILSDEAERELMEALTSCRTIREARETNEFAIA